MPSATSLPTSLPTTLLGALSPDPKLQALPGKALEESSDPGCGTPGSCLSCSEAQPLLSSASRPDSPSSRSEAANHGSVTSHRMDMTSRLSQVPERVPEVGQGPQWRS